MMSQTGELYLNFGAGNPVEGWVNLDASPFFLLPRWVHSIMRILGISRRSRHFRKAAYEHYRFKAGENLPFDDAAFRAIYCSHVLEHMPANDIPELLAEFRRVLVPGGILRVIVPDLKASALALLSDNGAWTSIEEPLQILPTELRASRLRAALEGFAGFPSMHRTVFLPDNIEKTFAKRWRVRTGLGYHESAIEPQPLRQVEQKHRCEHALVFELEKQ